MNRSISPPVDIAPYRRRHTASGRQAVVAAAVGLCVVAALLGGCSPPVGSAGCTWRPATKAPTGEHRTLATSDLTLSVESDRYHLKADMAWNADSTFLCDVFGPFGSLVATIESGPESGEIVAGRRRYRFEREQTIGEIDGLSTIPFTFGDLIRILQGRYAADLTPPTPPDTVQAGGRRAVLRWETNSAVVSVTLKGARCRVEEVAAVALDSTWHVQLSDFDDGRAHDIRFGESKGNYFVLRHRKVVQGD